MNGKSFSSTPKALLNIVIYFILFEAGDLINTLFWDYIYGNLLPGIFNSEFRLLIRMLGQLLLTCLFFWFYTTKVVKMKMNFFRISMNIRFWGIIIAILLPTYVILAFLIVGKVKMTSFEFGEIVLIVITSIITALKAGITEEMLFRGYIMKILEDRWNKYVAVLAPSFIFSLLHIPAMEYFSVAGIILLIIGGTLVGAMFSVITYKGNSIANSAIIHSAWNFAIVTDVLHITTEQGQYHNPIFSIIIPDSSALLTGAGFGVEVSIIAIIGYAFILLILSRKKIFHNHN